MHPSVHARLTPDKPAAIMATTGESVSFGELDRRSIQGSRLLRSVPLDIGETIAVLLQNHPKFFEVTWAAQRAGLYYTAISTRLTLTETEYILRDSGSRLLVTSSTSGTVAPALPGILPRIAYFALGVPPAGYHSFEQERAAFPSDPMVDERPGMDMLYSSGTTGRPKGVKPALPVSSELAQHTNNSLLGQRLYGFDATTVYLCPAPLYHAAPLRWSMAVQKLGGTVVLMEKFDAETVLRLIERYGVTHAQFVPTHLVRMLRLPSEIRSRYNLGSLRVVIHAGAPCPIHVKHAVMAWLGPIVHEYYGGTEGNGVTAIGPEEWQSHIGSVGKGVLGEVKICDDAGELLPPGAEGLVYFANGRSFEYHNDPLKTAESRNRHGWTTIGDVGYVDEHGYLYLTDRKSFMIISGGVNIYPQEIENALLEHPAVADAAVIGAPDEEMGERVVAIVQPSAGAAPGPELADELTLFLRKTLSGVKIPRQVEFRSELPREPTGKLMKRRLREDYVQKMS